MAEDGLLKYLVKGSVVNDRCDPLFEPNGQILDLLEWIAKLTLHIPDHRAQTIRYYGLCGLRGRRLPKVPRIDSDFPLDPPVWTEGD